MYFFACIGPATSDVDFNSSNLLVNFFPEGPDILYVDIPIMNNDYYERTEYFLANLSLAKNTTSFAVINDPQKINIFIYDGT